MTSLKQKILGLRDMEKLYGNSTKILDNVSGLLDEAIMEIKQKVANLSWVEHLKDKDKLWVILDDVLAVLDEVKNE